MTNTGENSSLLEAIPRILRHQGWQMAVFFVLVVGTTALATVFSPRYYRSHARLLLRLGRENTTLDPTVTLGQQQVFTVPYARDLEINTALDILSNREMAEKVVDSLGPEVILGKVGIDAIPKTPAPEDGSRSEAWQQALELFRKNFQAEVVKKASILAVSYEATSPELAQAVVAHVVTYFSERHMEIHRTPGSQHFLTLQASRLEAKVKQTEEELRQKKTTTGVASPEAQRQLLATRLSRLEDELGQARIALAAAEAEAKNLEAQVAKTPAVAPTATTKGIANQATDQVRAQHALLKIKEAELTAKNGASHPDVRQVRKQLEVAEAILRKEEDSREQVTSGPNKPHEEAQLALSRQRATAAAQKARAQAISEELQAERGRLTEFATAELEIGRLQRRLEIETGQLKRYSEGLEQGQVDRALQAEKITNVAVVQPATLEPRPVRPKLTMNLLLGAGFGLVGAAGLGTVLDYRRRSGGVTA